MCFDLTLNEHQQHYYKIYAVKEEETLLNRTAAWGAHKIVASVSVPYNTLMATVNAVGIAVIGVPVAIVKVAIFAGTLGNRQLNLKTGFLWTNLGGHLSGLLQTGYEFTTDFSLFCMNCVHTVRHVMDSLGLLSCFNAFCKSLKDASMFVANRINAGCERVAGDEIPYRWNHRSIFILSDVDEKRSRHSYFSQREGTFKDIALHALISCVNLPLSAVVTTGAIALGFLSVTASVVKVALFALTNHAPSIPTGIDFSTGLLSTSLSIFLVNALELGVDGPVLLYKMVESTGVLHIAATIASVVAYIPFALCE